MSSTAAFGQPPAETCGAGDSLGAMDALPVSLTSTPMFDDLDLSGPGCDERGLDHVTCFTPEASCTVDVFCGELVRSGENQGAQVAASVFEGACTTSPASCTASSGGFGDATISGVALSGGTSYCFVCETDFEFPLGLAVTATSGDCGSLPVGLQAFSVD